jgi:transcriptional regulator with XRE-family HTH domain
LVLDVLVLYPDDLAMDRSVREFGRRVRSMREQRHWTQEELADRSGLTSVQISRIERGVREIRLTTLLRLIGAFDAKPDELLGKL